ncbi:hypothetical protein BV898_00477 [Hypsibius exemplaris]|uniref:Uncharacterized protein n=1 Tax=Hypsibius exemplaris TaxID=2072580 RepID=A0A1W0XDQ4_HYPEX|nr:hypothetical protein BV898_00477 [Hypsibius exemplaris]
MAAEEKNMAVFSRLAQQWNVNPVGEVKICVLGLTMTTDSPKFVLLTVTCGLVSAGLLSQVSRAFLCLVWRKACRWCSTFFLSPPSPIPHQTSADSAVSNQIATASKQPLKMGQKMTVTTSVQLSTDAFEPELDILTSSYEIVDLPRLRVRTRDAQTSPILSRQSLRDVGVATLGLVGTQDRSTSPISSSMFESGSPDDLLLMFEGEEEEEIGVLRDESGLPLKGDNSELYEKLGSIQKALQEANQEMDSYMSTLSEISQRHLCSPEHTGSRGYLPGVNFSAASSGGGDCTFHNSNNGLAWEDEFSLIPSFTPFISHSPCRQSHPTLPQNSNLEDLMTWHSDLHFYSGGLSYPVSVDVDKDTSVEIDSQISSSGDRDRTSTTTLRDSGCRDVWDAEEDPSGRMCSACRSSQKPRPLSAPSGGSGSGYSSPVFLCCFAMLLCSPYTVVAVK